MEANPTLHTTNMDIVDVRNLIGEWSRATTKMKLKENENKYTEDIRKLSGSAFSLRP